MQDALYDHSYPRKVRRAIVQLNSGKTVCISGDCVPHTSVVRLALIQARRSTRTRAKHAAVVFTKGRVICSAVNVDKTHPRGSGPYTKLHAEIRAILSLSKHTSALAGLKMLVVKVDKTGRVRTSRPCVDCIKLIKKLGIQVCWSEL